MNNTNYMMKSAIAIAVAASLFVGCASVPKKPLGSEAVRAKLTALQGDSRLANGAPVALKDAEAAVRDAERVEKKLDIAASSPSIASARASPATP
jgi:outer membrane murein-binding lipoprotein Lpp